MKSVVLVALLIVTVAQALIVTVAQAQSRIAVERGVNVDVPTGDVRDVLRAVADAAGLQIVIPGELSGIVSIRLAGVSYSDAFDALLSSRGYRWRSLPSGLVVIEKERDRSAVVRMRYRSAKDVSELLTKMLKEGETVQALGDSIVIDADPVRGARLIEAAQTLDYPLRQVLVECRFQEMTTQVSRALGINWATLGRYEVQVTPKPVDLGTGQAFGAVLSLPQLSAVLSMLDATAGTRVLSKPVVLAAEGQTAEVSVGQQYPLPQYTFSQQQGVLQVSGFQFKDIGVLLKVTPRFAGDRISLEIEPEVSSVSSTTTFAGAGATTLPIIATRRVRAKIELADGETMAISGLVTDESSLTQEAVRGVARVPLIGALFRRKSTAKASAELVVFVTVRRVRPNGVASEPIARVAEAK